MSTIMPARRTSVRKSMWRQTSSGEMTPVAIISVAPTIAAPVDFQIGCASDGEDEMGGDEEDGASDDRQQHAPGRSYPEAEARLRLQGHRSALASARSSRPIRLRRVRRIR
jgi:hypothetical protein